VARYIVSRLAMAAIMALLATLVIFLLANTVPGDPVLSQLGDLAASNKEFVAEWRAKWGLDLPLWQRYLIFLQRLAHGDLGISIASQRPVLRDIADFAPATIELASIAFLLSIAVGVPLGVLAAVRRDSWIDHVARLISLLGVSAPTFWLAFIVLAVFYGGLQIAPGPGRVDAIALPPPLEHRALPDRQRACRQLATVSRCAGSLDAALDRPGCRNAGACHPHHAGEHAR